MSKNFIDYDIWTPQGVEKPGIMIILDPGHGGVYSGKYATAPSKMYDHGSFVFYEGENNRKVTVELAKKFQQNNIAHSFTTTSNILDESLDARGVKVGRIVSAYPKYIHLLLSIHANASSATSARGVEYWTTKELNDSDYAANIYFPYLYNFGFKVRLNRESENEYDKEESWKILRIAEKKGCMALLLELGFFSNKEEAAIMLTPEWIDNAAEALLQGTQKLITKIQTDGSVR